MPNPTPGMSYKQRPNSGNSNVTQPGTESAEQPIQPEEAATSTKITLDSNLPPQRNRPISYQGDADGAKRRSLLPQPGQTRYTSHFSDATTVKQDATTQQPVSRRLRPRSMYRPESAQPVQGKSDESTTVSRSIPRPNSISKPLELQPTGLGRSRSLRKPGLSTQPAQSVSKTSHTRTQSANIVSAPQKEVNNAKLPAERPKSLLVAPSNTSKSNSQIANPTQTATRASTRLAGLSRTASIKTRSDSSGSTAVTRTAPRPDDPVATQPRRREVLREETTRTARPAFTTLQQHFTPRKASKAPTSTFLHPAPIPEPNFLPPEVFGLQSELLQLHLLHETSEEVSRQWQLSAKRSLHMKFDEVASLHQAMLDFERAGQEQKNLQALLEWSTGTSSMGLVKYIQILSGPVHELPSLLEPGGRSQRLVDDFERWMTQVKYIRSVRNSGATSNSDLASIEGLDDSWKLENAALIRKVTSFARDLDELRQPSAGSSIASIVDTCKTLLRGLLDELHIMLAIEADVVCQEKEWVEARLQAIARDVGSSSAGLDMEKAAWRTR
ncbi:hypothetical protein GQ44DRAFT_713410 [Phaeosphaeriaceae sp. PMI808]|nr:hypothetical protein GQ44DRAFT_713410 [Phaeosphaeriaceae sp. PMI808]